MDAFDDDAGPGIVLDIWMDFHTKVFCQRASHGVGLDRCNGGPEEAGTRARVVHGSRRVLESHDGMGEAWGLGSLFLCLTDILLEEKKR